MTKNNWKLVIGLEVHAQISTKSKLFSRASTACESPNTCVDYLDLGLPGALPVLNKECVRKAIISGHALNMTINHTSQFDRKHYFYPDLPLGYQITQFYHPIAENGSVPIWIGQEIKNIGINRIHMETDAGKSTHKDGKTYIDLNRCGIPLMEIVTEPDFRSEEEVATFFRILQATLRKIGTCDGNMDKGQMRADVNVSLRRSDDDEFGTRVEIKNINSVNFMKKAIAYEYERQAKILESGEKIIQETRLFNENTCTTSHMRNKEDAADYRYMPDPDLPLLILDDEMKNEKIEDKSILPYNICKDIVSLGVSYQDAWIVAENPQLTNLFYEAGKLLNSEDKITLFKWIIGDVISYMKKNSEAVVNPSYLSSLIAELSKGNISGKAAKEVLLNMIEQNKSPVEIIKEKGLAQINSSEEIRSIVSDVMKNHQKEIESYKNGNENLKQFFVGQVIKSTKGKANPKITQDEVMNYLNNIKI
ncbi:Asp-tRNA(Asn)/Glu-tRNA(Gln) amidotransferase subunit GatB [Candidatus Cytomitobacter indipagum]|uniref:Aspartyl/glutamyl-tRNA(Asn/Gln) amidotransferase subunit B n=1 Tax=Candidatus Cytomitobacter indipagum TaxID=2601575 RepID=A0A5C0UE33_9PROT|nr:Asp-tRNA(Asn)/Glu-tRNA(Gln) amidotransferase subunit GatB [Candidatus Cytomitobacter indipagum]QEK37913.1 Asp-tRNA(Asn)/Glu-tRNA(Gln) amidotransferase subunit GatB [Candidatus Cytomitobacter indipagum]